MPRIVLTSAHSPNKQTSIVYRPSPEHTYETAKQAANHAPPGRGLRHSHHSDHLAGLVSFGYRLGIAGDNI